MRYTRNGVPQADTGFVEGDVTYPAGWIASNKSQWATFNIEEVGENLVRPIDGKYFWGWDKDGKAIEKELEDKDSVDAKGNKLKDDDGDQIIQKGVKTICKLEQNGIAKTLLLSSDWMAIRAAEGGTAVPSAWATYRAAVRTKCNERQAKIDTATTTTKLKELMQAPAQVLKSLDPVEMKENPEPHLPEWPTAPKS